MISNAKDQVSLPALLRSEPMPSTWMMTYGWGRDFWTNQENGLRSDPEPMPGWSDVGKVTGWRLRK